MSASPTPPHRSIDLAGEPTTTRILSIDILRGITMALMIFVNDLASVHGLSKWTYHFPAHVDAMSYVDMVFPTFLFVVGMAIPLAIRQRLGRNLSLGNLWFHILLRTLGLVVLGLILANVDFAAPALTHLNNNLWGILALLGAILLWLVPRPSLGRRAALAIRVTGLFLLVTMAVVFRRLTPPDPTAPAGHIRWIDFAYPEILGLIGLTYLGVCLLYVPTRRFRWAPLGWLVALLLFNIAACTHSLPLGRRLEHIPMYLNLFDNGAMSAITFAGILVSTLFLGPLALGTTRARILAGLAFAVATFVLGYALIPFGISKIRATPTWSLWSVSAATFLFLFLFWLLDLRHLTRWTAPFRAPGSNTLLTYLLPDLYVYFAGWLGFNHLLAQFNHGVPGVLRAVLFTVAMLGLSALLTRAKLRLQL